MHLTYYKLYSPFLLLFSFFFRLPFSHFPTSSFIMSLCLCPIAVSKKQFCLFSFFFLQIFSLLLFLFLYLSLYSRSRSAYLRSFSLSERAICPPAFSSSAFIPLLYTNTQRDSLIHPLFTLSPTPFFFVASVQPTPPAHILVAPFSFLETLPDSFAIDNCHVTDKQRVRKREGKKDNTENNASSQVFYKYKFKILDLSTKVQTTNEII